MWLLVGDSHGNINYMLTALAMANYYNVDGVIQLGDFGFWPGSTYASDLKDIVETNGMTLWVINGNHDDPAQYRLYSNTNPSMGTFAHIPNGTKLQIGKSSVGFMGGGVSIDYYRRVRYYSWWPEELPSEEEIQTAIANGEVDVWLTHDCVVLPPGMPLYNFREPIQTWVNVQGQNMSRMFHALKPKVHIHGHMHNNYDFVTRYGIIHGLGFESVNSLALFDFDTHEYKRLTIVSDKPTNHYEFDKERLNKVLNDSFIV